MTNESVFAAAMDHLNNKKYGDAENLFRELMNQGNIHAQINLATMFLDPNLALRRYKEAYELLIDAVEKVDGISAANNIGMMYMAGIHVEQDFHKAFEWFQKGADHQIGACFVNLAKIHVIGAVNNGKPDLKSAIKCFIQSYKFGYPMGLDEISTVLSRQTPTTLSKEKKEELVDYIKRTYIEENSLDPKSGDGSHEVELAEMFDRIDGTYSYKSDAAEWYAAAREKGCTKAINNLAAMFLTGEHVQQDLKQAYCYFKEAAELGDAFAMKNLGCCFLEGNGTAVDLNAASHWLMKSVEGGCKHAIPPLAFTLYSINPLDSSTYIGYMEKACDLNHRECLLILGKEYLEGENLKQDLNKGISLLKRASSLGEESAPLILGLHYISTEKPENYADASKYLLKAVSAKDRHPKSLSLVAQIFFNKREYEEFDKSQTLRLNKLLADSGDSEAQARVAALYLENCESDQDIEQALKYAILSADQKCIAGLSILVTMFITGDLPDKSILPKALDDLEEASKNGSAIATFALGQFYEVGTTNIAMDKQLAIEYISQAAEMGYEPASLKIKSMLKN